MRLLPTFCGISLIALCLVIGQSKLIESEVSFLLGLTSINKLGCFEQSLAFVSLTTDGFAFNWKRLLAYFTLFLGLNLRVTSYSLLSLRSIGTGMSDRFLKSMLTKKSWLLSSTIEL